MLNRYGYFCFHCKDITHFNVMGSCMTCGKDGFREANLADVKKLERSRERGYRHIYAARGSSAKFSDRCNPEWNHLKSIGCEIRKESC